MIAEANQAARAAYSKLPHDHLARTGFNSIVWDAAYIHCYMRHKERDMSDKTLHIVGGEEKGKTYVAMDEPEGLSEEHALLLSAKAQDLKNTLEILGFDVKTLDVRVDLKSK